MACYYSVILTQLHFTWYFILSRSFEQWEYTEYFSSAKALWMNDVYRRTLSKYTFGTPLNSSSAYVESLIIANHNTWSCYLISKAQQGWFSALRAFKLRAATELVKNVLHGSQNGIVCPNSENEFQRCFMMLWWWKHSCSLSLYLLRAHISFLHQQFLRNMCESFQYWFT